LAEKVRKRKGEGAVARAEVCPPPAFRLHTVLKQRYQVGVVH
jgi:hypothetical protein